MTLASGPSRIIGTGMTRLVKGGESASMLKRKALEMAFQNVDRIRMNQLDGLITVPSLSEGRFMDAHFLATSMNLLPNDSCRGMMVKTIDTGGASPVSALLEADDMIKHKGYSLVAIVAGDAVASMSTEEFLSKANSGCAKPDSDQGGGAVIPEGYNRVAEWQLSSRSVTREQLAMVSVLMSRQAVKHPYALTRTAHTLDKVLKSARIASATSLLECARRADGAAAVIVASNQFITDNFEPQDRVWGAPLILGGGEASGPLYLPDDISEDIFSCEKAALKAYAAASTDVSEIDYFGIYDCFPICFIKAVEAVGLAPKGCGGQWVEDRYLQSERQGGLLSPSDFPVNTHGGLLAFGAPWETPAMHSIIEAVMHLTDLNNSSTHAGENIDWTAAARTRQVPNAKKALVYGNGGIFSASAVAILGR